MKSFITFSILVFTSSILFSQSNEKISCHENGNKRELLNYNDNNDLHGVCIAWNDSGNIVGKVHYKNGLKHGKWFIWYDNGKPAYKLYYYESSKVGKWMFYDTAGNVIGIKDYGPKYIFKRNSMLSFGTQTLNDLSVEFTHRIQKNRLLALGVEYSTYISDYTDDNYVTYSKFQSHSILGVGGWQSNGWMFFLKSGVYFDDDETRFNYGVEFLTSFNDDIKIIPCVGISLTKETGIQMKIGICF